MSRVLKRGLWLSAFLGLVLTAVLIAMQGVGEVFAAVQSLGPGALAIPFAFVVPALLATWSWQALFSPGQRPGFWLLLRGSWIGFGINWLLPVAQIGGEVAKAHHIVKHGTPASLATAATVADKTLQLATQVVFTLMGAAAFALFFAGKDVLTLTLAGAVFLSAMAYLFYRAQHRGLFRMGSKLARRFVGTARAESMQVGGEQLDVAVREVYARQGPLWWAFLLRLCFRIAWVGETYLILHLLGHDASWTDALIIESLTQAVRAGAFLVPGGIGAQEGAIVAIGWAIGLSGPESLALAIAKRWRELAIGVPAILYWNALVGWRLFSGSAKGEKG